MAIKDKTGQKFGHLTVLRLSEKRHPKNNKILWECQCDCGNQEIIYATSGNLTQGYKTSCGCAKKAQFEQVIQNNIRDLTNEKFGKLTPLYYIENSSPPLWHCLCDCGNELDVASSSLIRGDRTSCGCKRKDLRKSLIGLRFGKLTVVERVENYISPSGQTLVQYKCKCDCGNEIIAMGTSLQQHLVSSCGCLRSAGELVIQQFLQEMNIPFQTEYRFADCIDQRPLSFDFCIFKEDGEIAFLIEVNGKQHYEPCFSTNPEVSQLLLKKQQKHDQIKETYCLSRGLDLLIIPYYQLNQFKTIIQERLKHYEL